MCLLKQTCGCVFLLSQSHVEVQMACLCLVPPPCLELLTDQEFKQLRKLLLLRNGVNNIPCDQVSAAIHQTRRLSRTLLSVLTLLLLALNAPGSDVKWLLCFSLFIQFIFMSLVLCLSFFFHFCLSFVFKFLICLLFLVFFPFFSVSLYSLLSLIFFHSFLLLFLPFSIFFIFCIYFFHLILKLFFSFFFHVLCLSHFLSFFYSPLLFLLSFLSLVFALLLCTFISFSLSYPLFC